jgi:hypothetical protein
MMRRRVFIIIPSLAWSIARGTQEERDEENNTHS